MCCVMFSSWRFTMHVLLVFLMPPSIWFRESQHSLFQRMLKKVFRRLSLLSPELVQRGACVRSLREPTLWQLHCSQWSVVRRGAFSSFVAVCYPDDLALLPPSSSALIIIIRCFKYFAGYHGLRFNASKIQLIRVSCSQLSNCHACIFFCGWPFPC